jgi:DNA-binding LacI/PurR family transcriptional regulator
MEREGVAVPRDVSVVGYDNTALAALGRLSLTTVDQPRTEMGRLAVQCLLERVGGSHRRAVRHELAPELVIRRTTAPPRQEPGARGRAATPRVRRGGPLAGTV